MNKLTKSLSYLVAGKLQVIGIMMVSWWLGEELNVRYPLGFNWIAGTLVFGLIVSAHTFYLIIKTLLRMEKIDEENDH